MGNLAFQNVDFLLTDIQRSTSNREFLGLQSIQEPTKAVQFIGWVGVVHKPMIGGTRHDAQHRACLHRQAISDDQRDGGAAAPQAARRIP